MAANCAHRGRHPALSYESLLAALTTLLVVHLLLVQLGGHEGPQPVCVFPEDCPGDRLVSQLQLYRTSGSTIKIWLSGQRYEAGDGLFKSDKCLVRDCQLTHNSDEARALVFENADVLREPNPDKRSRQIWIAHLLESPLNTFDRRLVRSRRGRHKFNWTASYRSDSDLVTPYSKFVLSNQANYSKKISAAHQEIIRRKRPHVAWFVSNCHAKNRRLEYAQELAKHIQVDIFGKCGNLTCDKRSEEGCLRMLNQNYKFYLAFENSNCRQYMTEKLYRNALGYNSASHLVLPIVMGAPREDYESLAPPNSFLHVDDFESPRELALYLRQLAADDELYYSYFRWKTMGQFIETKFLCRLCAMLHHMHLMAGGESLAVRTYADIKQWWLTFPRGAGEAAANAANACEAPP